jgi:hypothetical protein
MRRLNLVALLGAVVVGLVAVGCGSPDAGDVGSDAGSVTATAVQGPTMRELLESEGDSRLVATMRGPGQIGYLPPVTRREGNAIVTVFRIKNISTGALAGFKVDEFWYDSDGETVTGDSHRMRRPFLVDEVIEITLRVPRDSRMDRSNYEFTHQNGVVEANVFEEMEEPTPVEEDTEETDESDEAETPAR